MADRKFPDTETYLINWLAGGCGAFITMLVYNIVYPNMEIKISPSKYGHAHTNQQVIPNTLYIYNENFVQDDYSHSYKTVDPISPIKPLILYDHVVPDLDILFDRYTKAKNIVIRVSDKMIPLLHGNVFYKTTMDFDYTLRKNTYWEQLKRNYTFLKDYDTPYNAPPEVIEKIIRNISDGYVVEEYYSDRYIPPKEYSDRMYFIDFYDIIFNKTKVLNQLSEITNRPISEFVNEQYDIYLKTQLDLLDNELAWMNLA